MKNFEINLIIDLQRILRSPLFDWLFYIISFAGDEMFFLFVTVVLLWCVNKRLGYRFFNVYMLGQLFVGAIKTLVARPRPYNTSINRSGETVSPQSVLHDTSGYSFPSGHSQSIANMSAQIALAAKKRGRAAFVVALILGGALSLAVMFSRMYLGQHYLTDVLAGTFLGVLCAIIFGFLSRRLGSKEDRLFLIILPLTVILFAVLMILGENTGGAAKLLGVWGAVSLGYFLEKHTIKYNVKSGGLLRQAAKLLVGLSVLVIILEGSKLFAFDLSARQEIVFEYARYFVAGFFAAFVLPAYFKFACL